MTDTKDPKVKTITFIDRQAVYGDLTGMKDLRVPFKSANAFLIEWIESHRNFKIHTSVSENGFFGNSITIYYSESD